MKKINIIPGNEHLFNDEVGKRPIFVKFYMDGCPHCENMKPAWRELENELISNYTGDFTIMNVNARALNNIDNPIVRDIQGFPTIFMINKDGRKMADYDGDRSKKDMLTFIENNVSSVIKKQSPFNPLESHDNSIKMSIIKHRPRKYSSRRTRSSSRTRRSKMKKSMRGGRRHKKSKKHRSTRYKRNKK